MVTSFKLSKEINSRSSNLRYMQLRIGFKTNHFFFHFQEPQGVLYFLIIYYITQSRRAHTGLKDSKVIQRRANSDIKSCKIYLTI